MRDISYRLSEKPHPATTLLILYPSFAKNVTKKDIQDGHYYLSVTSLRLTLHSWNHLLPPLPLAGMLFLAPQTADEQQPLLLASRLTIVPVRHPTKFVIPMTECIRPRTGSCLTPHKKNINPTTIILIQKRAMLPMKLPLMPYLSLAFLQRSLPVDIQIILPVMIPLKRPQYCYLHSHPRSHFRSYLRYTICTT